MPAWFDTTVENDALVDTSMLYEEAPLDAFQINVGEVDWPTDTRWPVID